MAAVFIKIGESPPTIGGDFERHALTNLRDALPPTFVVIGNPSIPTFASNFYEVDAVIAAPDICEVIDFKCIRAEATIYEDMITGIGDFSVPQVFSLLENKCRVLAGRLKKPPFASDARVQWRVVVPNGTKLLFKYSDHRVNHKVMTLAEAIQYYSSALPAEWEHSRRQELKRLRGGWNAYAHDRMQAGNRTTHSLGGFQLKHTLSESPASREFCAVDGPPCRVEVHLKEFPHDPLLPPAQLESHLLAVSREMRTLRKIRHQYVACVIGHFQTGASLVQVSDWFEGRRLEDLWPIIRQISLHDKLGLLIKIAQGLAFCHNKGVFHRNLSATSVLIAEELDDLRLGGFEFSKDLESGRTLSTGELDRRDPRLRPPEELVGGTSAELNPRLYDIFQAGVLFYRMLENGEWPYTNALDYYTANGVIRPLTTHDGEAGVAETREIVASMIRLDPGQRPDVMQRVEGFLNRIVGRPTQA